MKSFKPDNVKPSLTLSVVSGGLNFSDWEHQWVSTYCFRITDASCIRREVRNQGHILLQGSLLTHLLSLLSHHASFRGASGLAKNAKNPRNGPHSYCSKKNCWVCTEQQWPAQHWPKAAALERHKTEVTSNYRNTESKLLSKEENTYRKSFCKEKSHFCLLMSTTHLLSRVHFQYSSISAPGLLSPKKIFFKKSKSITPG